MIITIGGSPGSGKGTVGKLLAKRLKYDYVSMGDLWDAERKKHGMSSNEFHEYLRAHPEFDNILDKRQEELGKKHDNLVLDSRLGFHFVPSAFKVYLDVDPITGAERVFEAHRTEEQYASLEEAKNALIERKQNEREQHTALYGADSHDMKNFDAVIDTTKIPAEAVVETILSKLPQGE